MRDIAVTRDLELLDNLAEMAVECLSLDVDQRPTMMEVAEQLFKLSRSRGFFSREIEAWEVSLGSFCGVTF